MKVTLYKYHGAGNDFLIADARDKELILTASQISLLCHRRTGFGADGLMLLKNDPDRDFCMDYYNSDGSGGMMCGNGGRCIVAFAADCGITSFDFIAPDGPHSASILSDNGREKTVRLKMKDVLSGERLSETEFFLDTGTRHYVRIVNDVDDFPVEEEGRKVRYQQRFAPIGVNANFVELTDSPQVSIDKDNVLKCATLKVRTYEKGVEAETLACGTGIVASALSAHILSQHIRHDVRYCYDIRSRISSLKVDFVSDNDFLAKDLYLTGPAYYVGKIECELDGLN